jgi:2'-5' RNA ligase
MNTTLLYFVALVPPDLLRKQINDIKIVFANEFKSSKSLNSPPHITLIPPFRADLQQEEEILKQLSLLAPNTQAFALNIDGFGAFGQTVIYLKILKNSSLDDLRKRLIHSLCHYTGMEYDKEKKYIPHITLASRDLSVLHFRLAWKKYRHEPFKAQFVADGICLLKHNGKTWDIISVIDFCPDQLPG